MALLETLVLLHHHANPVFLHSQVVEGKAVHLEARLAPASDPHMAVEWLKDGAPLHNASRFRVLHDFGFVALDILHTTAQVRLRG